MKNIFWLLVFWFLSTGFSVNAQSPSEDFCKTFPLNSRCKEKNSNSRTNISSSSNNEIVENLTIEKVERYLRELGYLNLKRDNEYTLSFFIKGRPCFIVIASNGKGMVLSSAYPQDKKASLEAINDWNKSFRYSFAYIWTTSNNKQSIFFQTNLTVTGGVTETRIKNFFVLHSDYQTRFTKYLDSL
ncbi:MAG: YbjN domain-containing protein [Xenococcaceae cyanobacterium MO_188.B19]|nr:YbjN domain-containing protein [Xenococcaceae cyanobacterium MO_188.B19]